MLKNLNLIILIGFLAQGITTQTTLDVDNDVIEVSDLQRLLKLIQNGNVESSHANQHKGHHSKSKNGEDHNLMNIQTLNLVFKHNNLRRDKRVEKDDPNNKDAIRVNKIMCAITGSYGCNKNDDLDQIETDDSRSLGDDNLINKDKKELSHLDDEDSYDSEYKDFQGEAQNDLELLLNDLEKNLLVKEDRELRCHGNRCGRGGNRERGAIRCKGDRCELRVNDKNNKDQLRCKDSICSKNRYDDDHDNINKDLRCIGDRCGRFRVDDDERKDDGLRCRGNRCGDARHDDLRCREKRCTKDRSGLDNDDNKRDNSGNEIDELRCKGNRCGEDMDDDDYDDNRKDDSRADDLRCSGNRCESTRNHIDGADIDSDFKSVLDNYGKRYKINNELDAIVLDVDDLENVLPTLDTSENFKDDEIKDDLRIKKRKKPFGNIRKKKKTLLGSRAQLMSTTTPKLPVTLPIVLGEEIPFKLEDRAFTFSEFIEFMRKKHKAIPIDVALTYIQDGRFGERLRWNEYFTKAGIEAEPEDRLYLRGLRRYYNSFVQPPKENYLPYARKLLENQLGINKIEVVPGSTNKIIIPTDLYNEIVNSKNTERGYSLRSEKKRLLPLTMKQKIRLSQQQSNGEKEKTLVPFVFNVKGLGQVNP